MDIEASAAGLAALGASWVIWLLVGLSVVSLAIALERAVTLWQTRDEGRLQSELRTLLRRGELEAAHKRVERSKSTVAQVVGAGLQARTGGPRAVEEHLAAAGEHARLGLERRLAFLGTVGSNAPFIGLLGTVIGIIRAFQELDAAAGQVTQGLMTEIGEALIVTALGLLVALPAVVFFNLFQRSIRTRIARAQAVGRELLAALFAHDFGIEPAE